MSKIKIWVSSRCWPSARAADRWLRCPSACKLPTGKLSWWVRPRQVRRPRPRLPTKVQARYLATQSMEACMNSWDPGTHMTKEAWRTSCERIKQERLPYVQKR